MQSAIKPGKTVIAVWVFCGPWGALLSLEKITQKVTAEGHHPRMQYVLKFSAWTRRRYIFNRKNVLWIGGIELWVVHPLNGIRGSDSVVLNLIYDQVILKIPQPFESAILNHGMFGHGLDTVVNQPYLPT